MQTQGHSIRKWFTTELTSLGVQPEYAEYLLGHRSSTYHDITSTSVEFLRDIYNMAELRISKPTSEAEYRQEIHNGTAAKPGRKAGRISSTTTTNRRTTQSLRRHGGREER